MKWISLPEEAWECDLDTGLLPLLLLLLLDAMGISAIVSSSSSMVLTLLFLLEALSITGLRVTSGVEAWLWESLAADATSAWANCSGLGPSAFVLSASLRLEIFC